MAITTDSVPMGSGRPVTNFLSYCEGDVEPTLNKRIHTLIDCEKNYIIYIDDDLFVEWSTTNSYSYGEGQNMPEGFGDIANKTGHLETLSMVLLGRKQIEPFRRLLAEGMARIIGDRDLDKAQECLGMAEKFLKARSLERARTWYFGTSLAVAGIVSILACLLWLVRNKVSAVIGTNAFEIVFGSLLGGLGGFLAMLLRSRTIEMDASAGYWIHCLEGCTRVVMGVIAALLIALAVKADIVLGVTKTSEHSLAFLLVACFVAGCSERFVPSFISRIENLVSEKQGK